MSPEIAPIIDPAVRVWRPDREPVGVGTHFTIRGRLGVLPIRATSEVLRWEPHEIAIFRSVKGAGPMDMTATHAFEATDDGTRYTWRIDFDGPAPLVGIAARLFRPALERQQRTLDAYLRRA